MGFTHTSSYTPPHQLLTPVLTHCQTSSYTCATVLVSLVLLSIQEVRTDEKSDSLVFHKSVQNSVSDSVVGMALMFHSQVAAYYL